MSRADELRSELAAAEAEEAAVVRLAAAREAAAVTPGDPETAEAVHAAALGLRAVRAGQRAPRDVGRAREDLAAVEAVFGQDPTPEAGAAVAAARRALARVVALLPGEVA